ncbi:MAG: CHASE2 domain-containing protein [Candidatus Kapabacteria bacterium]|nr:CHASE2 domain-containing protein [Candidatus Kapabacteria bacterium]
MKFKILHNLIATGFVFIIIRFFPIILNLNFLDPIENTIQDLNLSDIVFSKMIKKDDIQVDTNIVLVNIGRLTRYGIAKQLEIINRYEPKVVGIDVFFRKLNNPFNDSTLKAVLQKTKNAVLVSKLIWNSENDQYDTIEYCHPEFKQNHRTGFVNFIMDKDTSSRTTRTFTPKQQVGNKTEINFSCVIASVFNPEKTKKLLDRNNEIEIINFRRNFNKYYHIDADEIFQRQDSLGFIRDKIVLMGYMGPNFHTLTTDDIFFTPMNEQYIGKSLPDMYGIVVHANVISMILDESFYYKFDLYIAAIIIFVYVFLVFNFFTYLRTKSEFTSRFYEPISILTVFASIFLFIFLNLNSIYLFRVDLNLMISVFVFLIIIPCYEAYFDSIKPLLEGLINKLKKDGKKK